MSRLQLAIDVSDLDEAIDFYTRLFATEPAKVRPGYANFAIDDPPLKLILFEDTDGGGTLNHLGVETETAAEVVAAEARLSGAGLETTGVGDALCCYADKTETGSTLPTTSVGSGMSRPATTNSSTTSTSRHLLPRPAAAEAVAHRPLLIRATGAWASGSGPAPVGHWPRPTR